MRHTLCAAVLAASACAFAAIFGNIRGIVHDPDHRPIAGVSVILRANASDWSKAMQTGVNGGFEITAVPLGQYTLSISKEGFAPIVDTVIVNSDSARVLHFQLTLAAAGTETVTVSEHTAAVDPSSSTPTTLIGRTQIDHTPGAALTNSLSGITDFVPGAYMTHDQLHIRGGHQVTWAVDGIPVPNTNIASNVGPQFDPKDADYIEVLRGGYSADYGDRTYGFFNVVPRTGFERNRQAEVRLTAGNFGQTNDQLSFGSHTERFAYYVSLNGNRSTYGLSTPVKQVIHDLADGFGGFSSLIFNPDSRNQLRLILSARSDFYQVPNDPEGQTAGVRDIERERDGFANFSWIHTVRSGVLLTVAPFFHYNSSNYAAGRQVVPSTNDYRASSYAGGQAEITAVVGKHNARAGVYAFGQRASQNIRLDANDGSGLSFRQELAPSGQLDAMFLEDQYRMLSWFTLNAGVRLTHFSGQLSENAASPRLGLALRVPKLNWVFRGFYGRYYQAPPLATASGPALDFALRQGLGFLPLHGERDTEYEYGLNLPVRAWNFDVNHFQTNARNYFDHNALGNSNIFFPVTIDAARLRGWEVALRSPRLLRTTQLHLAYSYQHALGRGAVTGGLTDFAPPDVEFLLDHDQRHTLNAGFDATLPRHCWLASNLYYGSGFADNGGPGHLSPHSTIDMSIGKSWGENWSLSVTAINVGDRRVLLDNSFTFGGTHFNDPRQVFAELRYRFHY